MNPVKRMKMEYDKSTTGIPSFPPFDYAEHWLIMSPDDPPSSRSPGRALIVGRPPFREAPAAALQHRGYSCTEVDEPYEAMVYLCKRPLFYSAIILSLNSLYREELSIIASIRRRFSHVDIWLSDTDGRQAALAEAMRLGADGLFADDGLHRVSGDSPASHVTAAAEAAEAGPEAAESQPATQPSQGSRKVGRSTPDRRGIARPCSGRTPDT